MEQRTQRKRYGRTGLLVVALAVAAAIATGLVGNQNAASAESGGTVNVTLAEWSISLDPGVIETGEVTFVATNIGERNHELVVLQSAFAPDALPLDGDEEFVLEDQVNVIARTERISPGGTASLTLALAPGHYTLICNLENHYARGQRISFLVTDVGVDPASLPNTGSGGLAGDGDGASPLLLAGLAAAAVIALSGVARIARRGRTSGPFDRSVVATELDPQVARSTPARSRTTSPGSQGRRTTGFAVRP